MARVSARRDDAIYFILGRRVMVARRVLQFSSTNDAIFPAADIFAYDSAMIAIGVISFLMFVTLLSINFICAFDASITTTLYFYAVPPPGCYLVGNTGAFTAESN